MARRRDPQGRVGRAGFRRDTRGGPGTSRLSCTRSRRPLTLAALALLLLAGCDARLNVEVEAGPDGSGEVRAAVVLDREAAAQVPDLAQLVRVDDLEEAGWRVEGPSARDDGGSRIEAVKSFRSPQGAARVMSELSGPTGPFRGFRLDVEHSYLHTRATLAGTVDLTRGLEGFSDDVLVQRLGSPLGVETATIERQLGKPLADVFHVEVVARLPGNEPRVWRPELGERLELAASSRRLNTERIVFSAVALLAGLALVAVLVRRRLLASR